MGNTILNVNRKVKLKKLLPFKKRGVSLAGQRYNTNRFGLIAIKVKSSKNEFIHQSKNEKS